MVAKISTTFLLIGFLKIFATEKFAEKFVLSLLNMKTFLGWIVQGETPPSQKIVKVLEKKMRRRKKGNFTSIFLITNPSLLQEASTEQIR